MENHTKTIKKIKVRIEETWLIETDDLGLPITTGLLEDVYRDGTMDVLDIHEDSFEVLEIVK